MTWQPERTENVLRVRPVAVLARPFRERDFVSARYAAFLNRLGESARHVTLAELSAGTRDPHRCLVSIRHDVDQRLDSALELARLEAARGIRATYLVLHTAAYYASAGLVPTLRVLQDELGHEIAWHNDLVTLECVHGVDARTYLRRELDRLRRAGIDIRGVGAHGSYWCHALGYKNDYFFEGAEPEAGFPSTSVVNGPRGRCEIPKASLVEFGFEYDANVVPRDHYFSDARFDARGRRWHVDALEPDALRPGERAIVLVHPCHWDASVGAKLARSYRRIPRRALSVMRRRPA